MNELCFDEEKAFAELRAKLRSWDINSVDKSQGEIDDLFNKLVNLHWDRNRIYNFTFFYLKENLSDSDYHEIPEAAFDYLGGIESSIIGHCSWESFLKIPGEPQEIEDSIAYVRGGLWKH
ncbi:hypothetical protein ACX122_01255 [Kosakonia cowanii]